MTSFHRRDPGATRPIAVSGCSANWNRGQRWCYLIVLGLQVTACLPRTVHTAGWPAKSVAWSPSRDPQPSFEVLPIRARRTDNEGPTLLTLPGVPLIILLWPAALVANAGVAAAASVVSCIAIRYALASRRRKWQNGLCSNCGYNLTGNVSGICPECGGDIQRQRGS